jgi:hypothetical protein
MKAIQHKAVPATTNITVMQSQPLDNVEDFMEKQELTKRERFLKYGGGRVAQALRAIEIIGNCANRQSYEFTEEEIRVAFAQLRKTLDETEKKFEPKQRQKFGRNFFETIEKED